MGTFFLKKSRNLIHFIFLPELKDSKKIKLNIYQKLNSLHLDSFNECYVHDFYNPLKLVLILEMFYWESILKLELLVLSESSK